MNSPAGIPMTMMRPVSGQVALDTFLQTLQKRSDETQRVERILRHIKRVIPLPDGAEISVIGCGPKPEILSVLEAFGYRASGVEPVSEFVQNANEMLNGRCPVHSGAAENLPYEDQSLDMVFFENVLEHVESPDQCLKEIFRVLRPGGLTFVTTTNRFRLHPLGRNDEFNVPFFNFFPSLLRESFVHQQLHYEPALANMTERPAVHWFSFSQLCALGRVAGFARFYSTLDTRRIDDVPPGSSILKRAVIGNESILRRLQQSPVLRTIALSQIGHDIMMWKRSS